VAHWGFNGISVGQRCVQRFCNRNTSYNHMTQPYNPNFTQQKKNINMNHKNAKNIKVITVKIIKIIKKKYLCRTF
jgi:hypothetical protein